MAKDRLGIFSDSSEYSVREAQIAAFAHELMRNSRSGRSSKADNLYRNLAQLAKTGLDNDSLGEINTFLLGSSKRRAVERRLAYVRAYQQLDLSRTALNLTARTDGFYETRRMTSPDLIVKLLQPRRDISPAEAVDRIVVASINTSGDSRFEQLQAVSYDDAIVATAPIVGQSLAELTDAQREKIFILRWRQLADLCLVAIAKQALCSPDERNIVYSPTEGFCLTGLEYNSLDMEEALNNLSSQIIDPRFAEVFADRSSRLLASHNA
jgi:hypothetical protein